MTEKQALTAILLELWACSDAQVCYVPNEGNAGDALIAAGMWCLFDEIGINPRLTSVDRMPENGYFIYSGGGNLVPGYEQCAGFLERCVETNARRVVVLPHTIRGHEKILKKLDERYYLFAREYDSFDYLKDLNLSCNIFLADDLAFSINTALIESTARTRIQHLKFIKELACKPKQFMKYLRWRLNSKRLNIESVEVFNAFRVDIESTGKKPARAIDDISNLYGSEYSSRLEAIIIANQFLRLLKRAQKINTNRLHIAVGSAIVGTPVNLYDNSYGKNRAIYEKSLADFANVKFLES